MALVNGKDVVLFVAFGEIVEGQDPIMQYKPIACARQISFEITRDVIETSVTGTGQWRTYTKGAISYTGSMEGLVFLNNPDMAENEKVDWPVLYEYISVGDPILVRYYEVDSQNNTLIKDCSIIITTLNEISSFDNISTFNANFIGSGEPVITWSSAGDYILLENGDRMLLENGLTLNEEN